MDALDRPVAEAADAERAAVADAAREDPPGVERRVAVVPRRARHLEVVVRLRASDAERREAGPEPRLHWTSLPVCAFPRSEIPRGARWISAGGTSAHSRD